MNRIASMLPAQTRRRQEELFYAVGNRQSAIFNSFGSPCNLCLHFFRVPRRDLLLLVVIKKRERVLVIVREDNQPLLRDRLSVEALATFNRLQWEKVVRHHPSEVRVRSGRNQVA